jgi:acyl-CoA-binding protein
MYALYNQAKNGDCKEEAPSSIQIVKKAKFDAYKKLSGMSKEIAMKRYVNEMHEIDQLCLSAGLSLYNNNHNNNNDNNNNNTIIT